ncbi:hypothetical protein EV421DRAFT_1734569 [Armillaria borealis]|uniref:Uncharacterized protein n=1 Tax=Armillaria borealis TaxID=47425 RepID=A0AA39MTZ4_9AGAR|nr:hypothetical protein EV421DRAFT_1734569 [Armillaria borealis]
MRAKVVHTFCSCRLTGLKYQRNFEKGRYQGTRPKRDSTSRSHRHPPARLIQKRKAISYLISLPDTVTISDSEDGMDLEEKLVSASSDPYLSCISEIQRDVWTATPFFISLAVSTGRDWVHDGDARVETMSSIEKAASTLQMAIYRMARRGKMRVPNAVLWKPVMVIYVPTVTREPGLVGKDDPGVAGGQRTVAGRGGKDNHQKSTIIEKSRLIHRRVARLDPQDAVLISLSVLPFPPDDDLDLLQNATLYQRRPAVSFKAWKEVRITTPTADTSSNPTIISDSIVVFLLTKCTWSLGVNYRTFNAEHIYILPLGPSKKVPSSSFLRASENRAKGGKGLSLVRMHVLLYHHQTLTMRGVSAGDVKCLQASSPIDEGYAVESRVYYGLTRKEQEGNKQTAVAGISC